MEDATQTAPVKAYSNKDLAIMYGVGIKAFRNWIRPHAQKIGLRRGHCYTPAQVRVIFSLLEPPYLDK